MTISSWSPTNLRQYDSAPVFNEQSAGLFEDNRSSTIRENENECSFRERSEVDQSFIDVQSSLLKSEKPRMEVPKP
jgi:hypothetical protein